MIVVDGKPGECIDAADRGIAYGDGVFRTMRTFAGHVAHWPAHYLKLAGDCSRLGIPVPDEAALQDDIHQVVPLDRDVIVKIIVTRGSGGRGYAVPVQTCARRIVASSPLPEFPSDRLETGVRTRWCTTRASWQPALAGIKHLNRLDGVLARSEWTGSDPAEGIMLDRDGHVVEGTMTNVFVLEGDRLVTPPLDEAGVAGVQRDRLLQHVHEAGLQAMVERVSPRRLLHADQVFLTNSVIGLWWVAELDGRVWQRHERTSALCDMIMRSDDA